MMSRSCFYIKAILKNCTSLNDEYYLIDEEGNICLFNEKKMHVYIIDLLDLVMRKKSVRIVNYLSAGACRVEVLRPDEEQEKFVWCPLETIPREQHKLEEYSS